MFPRPLYMLLLTLGTTAVCRGAEPAAPPPGQEPILRVEAGGPTAFVTALGFSPDGKTLYAAGFDKLVHVWTLDGARFVRGKTTYRVPIGPGLGGAINALAVSPDGAWLAVAGSMPAQGTAGFREKGWIVPRTGGLTPEMRLDLGTIHVFNTRTGAVRPLRGHTGEVLALAFAAGKAGGPLLVSAAREWDAARDAHQGAVRLWDLGREGGDAARARLGDLPDPVDEQAGRISRPGLAPWQPGAAPGRPLVAVAWEDPRNKDVSFRLWDPLGSFVAKVQDGFYNNTAAHAAAHGLVLTASLRYRPEGRQWEGHLQGWVAGPGAGPRPDPRRSAWLQPGHFPRALALVSAAGNGKETHAAVALRVPGRGEQIVLRLIDLATFQPVGDEVPLWKGATQPVVAATPGGSHLAVAGSPDHGIRVFSVRSLLGRGGEGGSQQLQSIGTLIRRVAFVRKEKARGLLLGEEVGKEPGAAPRAPLAGRDRIFDLAGRALRDDVAGWGLDLPDPAGWAVERQDGKTFRITERGQPVATVKLGESQDAGDSDFALLPPCPPLRLPLLAVGLRENGETKLCLYNAKSGELLRELAGHVNRVAALAFVADGRLLVSAGDDQQVCVWSLTSLGEIVGLHGQVPGLAVTRRADGKGVRVADPGRVPGVKKDETILGLVAAGKLQEVGSPRAFYHALWQQKPGPGARVTLRLAGPGGARDVEAPVGQAADQQQPLFALFVTRQGAFPDRREWIGWSPAGPYDTSGQAAEALVGWHRNTGDPREPVQLVKAERYRDDYYMPRILDDLADRASTAAAVEAWKQRVPPPPPEPKMTFQIDEGGLPVPADAQGRYQVGRPQLALRVLLDNGFPAADVADLTWQRGDKRGTLLSLARGEWLADLSGLPWARGPHALEVTLKTRGPQPRQYTGRVALVYQPPAPQLVLETVPPLVADSEEVALRLLVVPAAGQPARVEVRLDSGGQEKVLLRKGDITEPQTIETDLRLAPGVSRVRVEAVSQDAPEGARARERAEWSREVTYRMPKPQLALTELVGRDADGGPVTIRLAGRAADEPAVVDVPRFRVTGEAASRVALDRVAWAEGKDGEPRTVSGFDPARKPTRFAIDQEITVGEAGKPVLFRFLARAAGGAEAVERSLTVLYRPPLPRVQVAQPVDQQPLFWDETPARVPLEAQLSWPDGPHPATARLRVNGKEQGAPRALEAGARVLRDEVVLAPGTNEIELVVENAWRKEPVVARLRVPYRRPPQVLELKAGEPEDAPPRVTLLARVKFPPELPLTRAVVTSWRLVGQGSAAARSDRKTYAVPASALVVEEEGEAGWKVRLEGVPLEEGQNRIQLAVWNADGAARKLPAVEVAYRKPPPPRAEISVLAPRADTVVVTVPEYRVHFLVESTSPLSQVQLVRGQDTLFTAAGEALARLERRVGDRFRVEVEHLVALEPGLNLLSVVASNAGGVQASPARTITYDDRPVVRLRIDRVECEGESFSPAPARLAGGELTFPRLPEGRVVLHGELTSSGASSSALTGIGHLEVYVDGHRGLPVALDVAGDPDGRRRAFRTTVLLTRPAGSRVVLRLPPSDPPLVLDEGSRVECVLDCARPLAVTRQLAHVLIVGTAGTQQEVEQRALEAVGARDLQGRRFKLDCCAEGGVLYSTLIGPRVTREAVYGQLLLIQRALLGRARAGAVNDVVMLYYQGGHLTQAGKHYLQTSDSFHASDLSWSAIPCERLARFFRQAPGAHLLWLDVTRDQMTREQGAVLTRLSDPLVSSDAPHLALFRYSWEDERAATAEARLLTTLTRAMASSATLDELSTRLSSDFEKPRSGKLPWPSSRYGDQLYYDEYLPDTLKTFPLRREPAP